MGLIDSAATKQVTTNEEKFFKEITANENFIGRIFEIDYDFAKILTNDSWKLNVKGVPHGSFLVAIYHNDIHHSKPEGILLRVIGPTKIPQSSEIVETIVQNYMELPKSRSDITPDSYTKLYYEYSGLECRILGTIYFNVNDEFTFGTDLENFLGPHLYKVYKPKGDILKMIINSKNNLLNEDSLSEEEIGYLRYSSSNSYTLGTDEYKVPVVITTNDIVARRTAFFGMTRTGKSNTIKIIISAIMKLNNKFEEYNLKHNLKKGDNDYKSQIGQIVFDINGEYTFSNKQDEGSIYDKFKDKVVRFTMSRKKSDKYEDVQLLQYNFFDDETLEESFNLLAQSLKMDNKNDVQYVNTFANMKLFNSNFEDEEDQNLKNFFERERKRKIALYKCVLYNAGFIPLQGRKYKLFFPGLRNIAPVPRTGMLIDDALKWFKDNEENLRNYQSTSTGKEIWDDDYEVLYKLLNRFSFRLRKYQNLHNNKSSGNYKKIIDDYLREGKIVLVDLSIADEGTQHTYITKLCEYIFTNSMNKFTNDENPEYIQMYFEEAHNIFPKDDKDLKNIYNRLAKEGAKLNIGISYSTQEVSSISPSILKNTQNWFISHLNNKDEIKALEKYYDFEDFSKSILKNSDVGYARVKTYSNNFIIPVQIKKFEV